VKFLLLSLSLILDPVVFLLAFLGLSQRAEWGCRVQSWLPLAAGRNPTLAQALVGQDLPIRAISAASTSILPVPRTSKRHALATARTMQWFFDTLLRKAWALGAFSAMRP